MEPDTENGTRCVIGALVQIYEVQPETFEVPDFIRFDNVLMHCAGKIGSEMLDVLHMANVMNENSEDCEGDVLLNRTPCELTLFGVERTYAYIEDSWIGDE